MTAPALVPELLVTDLGRSLAFWRDLCGFGTLFDRPEDGFACIERDGARLMLDTIGRTRDWIAAPLEQPFGRGMNLEITLSSIEPVRERLAAAAWPFFLEPEWKRYRVRDALVLVRQFVVQDPDGYLVRFAEDHGVVEDADGT